MPAFNMQPIQGFPQVTSEDFPNPLLFAHDGVQFTGPIQLVDFIGGTVTESETGVLSVTLGGGGGGGEPAGPDRSLQFNNSGEFAGSSRGNYLLFFPSSGESVLALNEFVSPTFYSRGWDLYSTQFVVYDNYGTFSYSKEHMAALSSDFTSSGLFPPSGGFVGLNQACLFVSGGNSDTDEDQSLGGAWLIPLGLHFEDYATGRETRYVDIMPMDRPVSSITLPEFVTNAIQVCIGGTFYWIPLIDQ